MFFGKIKLIISMILLLSLCNLNAAEDQNEYLNDMLSSIRGLRESLRDGKITRDVCEQEIQNVIWDGKAINNPSDSEKVKMKEIFSFIAKELYSEHMLVSLLPVSVQQNDISLIDNNYHITILFGLQMDHSKTAIYDHVALAIEFYDEEEKKVSASMYHLTTSDAWTLSGILRNCGYSTVDYKIKKESIESIVAYLFYQYKRTHDHVRYYPYKTYTVAKTGITNAALSWLNDLSEQSYYKYAVFGKWGIRDKKTKQVTFIGEHNCITFIPEVLEKFGIFNEEKILHDVLGYSQVDNVGENALYAYLHWMLKGMLRTPEWLKALLDDASMTKLGRSHIAAADSKSKRPGRLDNAFVKVNDLLKSNIVHAVLQKDFSVFNQREFKQIGHIQGAKVKGISQNGIKTINKNTYMNALNKSHYFASFCCVVVGTIVFKFLAER